jgi:hypothetical protein
MFQYRLFVLFIFIPASWSLQPIDRNCCRYRCAEEAGTCVPWCQDQNTCIIKNNSDTALVKDDGCAVMYDTKVDESTTKSKEDCLKKKFRARKSFDELPFYVDPYIFKSSSRSHSPFIGLDLKYRYNMFQKLRFRFKNMNQNVCPENLSLEEKSPCNPRCVEIDKSWSKPAYGLLQNRNMFSYDCEVGFYIQEDKYVISSRDEYRLSICAMHQDIYTCGEFSFQMPSIQDLSEKRVLVLLDRQEFERRDKIVIHVPTTQNPDSFHVSILLLTEENKSTIFTQIVAVPHGAHNPMRIQLDHNIPSGRYQIAVIPLRGGNRTSLPSYSAQLERPDYGQHVLLIITIILLTIIIVGIILAGYKRRQRIIEESCIEPNIHVKAGLIQPRSVFVITQLENPDHTQVVKELCTYLRTHCGIADTYFPLDDEGGVHTAGSSSGDPWKWAQKSYEKVKETGTVLCIAGPNKAYIQGSSLWPGIQESQMFLVEPDLISLYREGRLICISLPYSDVGTLPRALPDQVVKATKQIPKDMNSILLQILKVERMGCSCFGCVCVEPKILPANLTDRSAGITLLDKMNRLTSKIHSSVEEKPGNTIKNSNSIIHRILKREVKRSRRRSLPPSSAGPNLSKSSPAIVSAETDKLLQDAKEDTSEGVYLVADLNGQTIQTTLKRYVEQKEAALSTITGGSGGSLMTSPGGHTLQTSPGGQSGTASGGTGSLDEPQPDSNAEGDDLEMAAAAPTTSIEIELEQNLVSIKSLANRDKTSVEDV